MLAPLQQCLRQTLEEIELKSDSCPRVRIFFRTCQGGLEYPHRNRACRKISVTRIGELGRLAVTSIRRKLRRKRASVASYG
jgi:hypothetical protein